MIEEAVPSENDNLQNHVAACSRESHIWKKDYEVVEIRRGRPE